MLFLQDILHKVYADRLNIANSIVTMTIKYKKNIYITVTVALSCKT